MSSSAAAAKTLPKVELLSQADSLAQILKPTLTEQEMAWLQAHPTLRLSIDYHFPPYSMLDDQGRFVGAVADFVAILEKQLGIKFEIFAPDEWNDTLIAAKDRRIDIIATAALTADRQTYLDFSEIYLNTPLVVMTRHNDYSLRSPEDLAYRTVALVEGYSSTQRVQADYPNMHTHLVKSPLEGLIAVAAGQADAYVGVIGVNTTIAARNGIHSLRIASAYNLNNGQRFAVRNDWPLLASIVSKALAEIPEEIKAQILQRWVPEQIPSQRSGRPPLSNDETAWLADHPRIRVGLARSDEPLEFFVESDGPKGFIPLYLDLIREKTGVQFDIIPMPDHSILKKEYFEGRLDMISLDKGRTATGNMIPLSVPFQTLPLALYSQRNRDFIYGIDEFSTKRVAVEKSSAAKQWLARYPRIKVVAENSPQAALQAVLEGRADTALLEVVVGSYLIEKYDMKGLYMAHVLTGEESTTYFSIRADWPELMTIVNKALTAASPEEAAKIRRISLTHTDALGISRELILFWGLVALAVVLTVFTLQFYLSNRRLSGEIRRRQRADEAVTLSEQRFSLTFEQAAVGIALVSTDGGWLRVNGHLCKMLGYSEAELLLGYFQDVTHPEDLDFDLAQMQELLAGNIDTYNLEKRYLHKDGQIIWGHLTVALVRDAQGTPEYFISVVENVTQKKHDKEKIDFLAHRDLLTGLPNRALLAERVVREITEAQQSRRRLALLFFDLDRFKMINETLGHSIGDQLLIQVAERLSCCLAMGDTLSRQGGDEFMLLQTELSDDDAVQSVASAADKLFKQLETPFCIEGKEINISASIGIAIYPDDGIDFETLQRNADTAMYSAKESGRNAYYFYTEQMNLDAVEYEQIQQGLRYALERGEMSLHYQPQFMLGSQKVIGVEALLRWTHPQLGAIPPSRFIPVAEKSGLIVALGAWVLQEACRQAVVWRDAGATEWVVAVNLSAVQFKREDLEKLVATALNDSGLEASQLELELTESILIQDAENVLRVVQHLREQGVRLSIDDFGTGYSSLSYLKRFPVNKLKIDQSFISDMLRSHEDEAIVQTIINLADNLGLTTIAEGIETPEQFAALQRLGCKEGQGYLFARPMPAELISDFISCAHQPSSSVPRT